MSLARWNPFLELRSIDDQMNRLFRRFPAWGSEEGMTTTEFAPPVDVYEDNNKVILKMHVAGVNPQDLDIRVDGNTIIISGERKFEREEKKENFRRIESEYGSFRRSFSLPVSADTDKIKADVENGLLTLDIPKRAESRGKQIRIGEHAGKTEKEIRAA